MHCPSCDKPETKVIDSRLFQDGKTIRRRRRCEHCEHRFTTYESFEIQLPQIVKNDGRRETFQREKIIRGIKKSCHKKSISMEQILNLVADVEKKIMEMQVKEISAIIIGEMVMEMLYKLDPVAYIRFASFYWNYDDIDDFVAGLLGKKRLKQHLQEGLSHEQ